MQSILCRAFQIRWQIEMFACECKIWEQIMKFLTQGDDSTMEIIQTV